MCACHCKHTVFLCCATVLLLVMYLSKMTQFDIQYAIHPIKLTLNHLTSAIASNVGADDETEDVDITDRLVIFAWTKFYSDKFNNKDYMISCPDYNCTITSNKSLLQNASAVVFHGNDFDWNTIPARRLPWQRYVFMLLEPPQLIGIKNLNQIPDFFNWTMTYRYDSDVHMPYGYLDFFNAPSVPKAKDIPEHGLVNLTRVVGGKTKAVVWFVSDCETPSHREHYVRALQQYISVDIFGACGKRKCLTAQCEQYIEDRYFFYFAGENSICKDYITEKVWSRLSKWSVPIVLQRKILRDRLPMSSFIALDDFPNAEAMATELRRLMENRQDYMKYFDWRRCNKAVIRHDFRADRQKGFCKLCTMLNDPNLPPKSYPDLSWWWHKLGKCTKGSIIWK